jgi:DNA-binding beta-propeller fold protein YncE
MVASGVDSPPSGTHQEGAFAPGTTFAGYRIDALVGRGGMGVVYRAMDLSLERPVALKLIAPELVEDERFRARFLREPRLAASLDHPNVIPIYEAGEHDGQLYLAMRFVGGRDLKRVLESADGMPPKRALEVVAQVAEALDAAHGRALVHLDVKPANVLIDDSGHAYLTDFGITKQLGGTSSDTVRAAGTLDYLAPEQIRGDPVDGRTDCYALACVLYECLAGAPPFRRATEAETLWAHMHEEPASVQGHAALDGVLRKALSKDPGARYLTCEAFVRDARAALGLDPSTVLVRRRRVRLGRRLLLVGGALLAAAVVAAILAITPSSNETLLAGQNSVAVIDPVSGELDAVIPVGDAPTAIAASKEAVWVLNANDGAGTISRIDPRAREVEATLAVPGTPRSLVTADGSLWVGTNEGRLFRIDPASDLVHEQARLPNADKSSPFTADAGWLTTGAGAVWAASFRSISSVDPASGVLRAGRTAWWGPMTHGFGSLWVAGGAGPLKRLSSKTLRPVATFDIPARPLSFAAGLGSVWVPDDDGRTVVRIEPNRNVVERTYEVGGRSHSVAIGTDAAWATSDAGTVARIDPETHAVSTIRVGGSPRALALGAGAVWVSVN